eukprot:COSAG02_NODE_35756_length_464_cov_0.701370_1_plen_28_part_10
MYFGMVLVKRSRSDNNHREAVLRLDTYG